MSKILLVGMVAFAVFCVILFIGLVSMNSDHSRSRLKAVRARRAQLQKELSKSQNKTVSLRDKMAKKSSITKLNEVIRIDRFFDMASLKVKASRAGWRSADAPARMLLGHVVLPFAFGGWATSTLYLGTMEVQPELKPLGVLVAVVIGFFLPTIIAKNAAYKRATKLSAQFPDALDLMLVCVEAGLTVDQSFMRITEEIGESIPELAEEFALTGAELAFLGDRRQAYDNLISRANNSPEFRSLAGALSQSEKYGTSVAQALRVLSEESRKNKATLVEKKAASMGPKMTIPMIVFILPCLFLIVIGPAVINILRTQH